MCDICWAKRQQEVAGEQACFNLSNALQENSQQGEKMMQIYHVQYFLKRHLLETDRNKKGFLKEVGGLEEYVWVF